MHARVYGRELLALAAANGIPADDLPLIVNGCSGGFSFAYALAFGRVPSCEDCCDIHDLHYQLGGSKADRKRADQALRDCAASAGSFPPGWKGAARRYWRKFRANIMYYAVRLFGGRYWG